MTWRVKIEPDVMRGGDRVIIGRPLPASDGMAEAVTWDIDTEGARGHSTRYPAAALPPDGSVLFLPDGVLDAIVAVRRTPGPSDEVMHELRTQLHVEQERVQQVLDAATWRLERHGGPVPETPEPEPRIDAPQETVRPLCGTQKGLSSCKLPLGHVGQQHGDGDVWWYR